MARPEGQGPQELVISGPASGRRPPTAQRASQPPSTMTLVPVMNAAGVRGEEEQRAVELMGIAHPGDRRVLLDVALAALVGVHAGGHLGGEPAGAQGVDAHALAGPLEGQLLGELHDGALGRHVVRLLDRRGADVAEDRRDVHDAAGALGHHHLAAQLRQVPDGRDVHLHRLAERVEVLVLDGDVVADAGVVDEHIHGAALADGLGDQLLAGLGVGDVGRHDDSTIEVGGQRGEAVGTARGEHHSGPDGVEHAARTARRGRRRRR